jgi:hypothetical protein
MSLCFQACGMFRFTLLTVKMFHKQAKITPHYNKLPQHAEHFIQMFGENIHYPFSCQQTSWPGLTH